MKIEEMEIKYGGSIRAGWLRIWPAGIIRLVGSGFTMHHGRRALHVAPWPAGFVRHHWIRPGLAGMCSRLNMEGASGPAGLVRIWPAGFIRIVGIGFTVHHGRRALHVAPWPAGLVRHHWIRPGLAGICSRGHPSCCKVGSSRHARLRGDPEYADSFLKEPHSAPARGQPLPGQTISCEDLRY